MKMYCLNLNYFDIILTKKDKEALLVIPQDDHISAVFFPGFQLATGKKGRFLFDLVRAGSQPALGD